MRKEIKSVFFGGSVFEIIFENDNYLIIDKPAGLLVYNPEKSKEKETSLADVLRDGLGLNTSSQRAGIVHRLDRETSGLIIVAKKKKYEDHFKKIFSEREIKKKYKALVWGVVSPKEGEINIPLGRGRKDRLRVVPKSSGRDSVTCYRVLKTFPNSCMSLLDIELKTGRTHQIRVHLSSIGHPVVGDKKYTNKKSDLERHFLHASFLSFSDPETKNLVEAKSDIPRDLAEFLSKIESGESGE